jgi:hypothetical protein
MKKLFFILLSILATFTWLASPALATNQFGLHLTQLSDLDTAAPLINSGGGDWGWVTITLRLDQLDNLAWQNFMNSCREKHIIPMVRVSTYNDGPNWKRPSNSDLDNIASFLNSLNWPSYPQYIVPFNEINHGAEWGGEVDIANFANSFIYLATRLKQLNSHFSILSSPLDLASPNNLPNYLSAPAVYDILTSQFPQYFELIDGLASHSYPNHGFVGSPYDTGAHSIFGYSWELDYLKSKGITKPLPVFITETGWPHKEGIKPEGRLFPAAKSSQNLLTALNLWRQDNRVQAVTPFIYNYFQEPFDHFSWLNSQGVIFPDYQSVVNLPRSPNQPSQITSFSVSSPALPLLVFPDITYQSQIKVRNTGQSIWGRGETDFCLTPAASQINLSQLCVGDKRVLPGHDILFKFNFTLADIKANSGLPVYLGWKGTPQYSLTPILTNSTIYRTHFNWRNLLPF